ncbi:hypothetical protein GCM10028857_12080 [Salinarchaeum chitinilyticum]
MAIGGVGPDVLRLVEEWVPSEVQSHEREYQAELQSYLDEQLNGNQSGPVGGFGGPSGGYAVSTEHGTSYGDVVVDDTVGIELKRNFTNSQKKKLRGQLEDYADNYSYVIACACGIEDRDGWRELENRYSGGGGLGMNQTQFAFVIKERDRMGSGGRPGQQGGFLDGVFGGNDDSGFF